MSKHLLEKIWRSVLCLLFVAFIRHHRFQPLRENYEKGYPIRLIPVALHMSAMIKAADRQGTRDQLPCPTKPFSGDLREFATELVSVCTVYALLFFKYRCICVYVFLIVGCIFGLPYKSAFFVAFRSGLESFTFCFETFECVRIFPSFCNCKARKARRARRARKARRARRARKARKARKARRARRACRAHKARRARRARGARWRSEGLFSFFPSPTPPPKVEVW